MESTAEPSGGFGIPDPTRGRQPEFPIMGPLRPRAEIYMRNGRISPGCALQQRAAHNGILSGGGVGLVAGEIDLEGGSEVVDEADCEAEAAVDGLEVVEAARA